MSRKEKIYIVHEKTFFFIDGFTIHSSFHNHLNNNYIAFVSSEQLDYLVKEYDQLQLMMAEHSLIGKWILSFTDLWLRI